MLIQRKQIRLKKYDYSQSGYYYVTICTENRECLFGNILNNHVGVGRDRPQPTFGRDRPQPTFGRDRPQPTFGRDRPQPTFGRDRPVMVLNQYGKIIKNVWESLPNHHPVILDEFQIMPNHIHFILRIVSGASRTDNVSGASRTDNVSGASRRAPTIQTPRTLGFIVGIFKTECTAQINKLRNTPGQKIFQRNYYEHIIRNETALIKIRQYIKNNPKLWNNDVNNPI